MNQYAEQTQNHELHQTLASFDEFVGQEGELADGEPRATFEKAMHAVAQYRAVLQRVDPLLIPAAPLNSANNALKAVHQQITAHLQDPNKAPAPMTQANQQINGALNQLVYFRAAMAVSDPESLGEEVLKCRERVDGLGKEVHHRKDELDHALKGVEQQLDTNRNALNEQRAAIEKEKGRIDALIDTQQTQFAEAQERRSRDFGEALKNHEGDWTTFFQGAGEQLGSIKGQFNRDSAALRDQFSEDAKKVVGEMEELREKAAQLLRITTNIGVTGNYNKMATTDRRWALSWRVIAIALMIGALALAWQTIELALKEKDYNLTEVLLRVGIAVVVAGPAVYAARESEKHRRAERQYRKMELELASIDPYIETLPEDKRHDLKTKLADRLFAQSDALVENKDDTIGFLEGLVKKAWNVLLKRGP